MPDVKMWLDLNKISVLNLKDTFWYEETNEANEERNASLIFCNNAMFNEEIRFVVDYEN